MIFRKKWATFFVSLKMDGDIKHLNHFFYNYETNIIVFSFQTECLHVVMVWLGSPGSWSPATAPGWRTFLGPWRKTWRLIWQSRTLGSQKPNHLFRDDFILDLYLQGTSLKFYVLFIRFFSHLERFNAFLEYNLKCQLKLFRLIHKRELCDCSLVQIFSERAEGLIKFQKTYIFEFYVKNETFTDKKFCISFLKTYSNNNISCAV